MKRSIARANRGSGSNEYAQYVRSGLKFLLTMASCLIPLIVCLVVFAWFSRGKADFISTVWDYASDIKGLIGIWLAVSGIVYAFTHASALEKQTEELRWLQRSLSTRRLTQFPMYLTQIQKLAKATKKDAKKTVRVMPWATDRPARTAMHLDILADCLDYGSFFSPDFHAAVHKALCRAAYAPGVQVRILVCGPMPEPFTGPSGQKLSDYPNHDQILSDYRSFLRGDPGFMDWLRRLKPSDSRWNELAGSWFASLLDANSMPSWDDLLINYDYGRMVDDKEKRLKQLLQIRQLWFAKDLQRVRVQIAGLPERQPLFFWIKYRYREQRKRDTRDRPAPLNPHTTEYDFVFSGRGRGMSRGEHSEAEMIAALKQVEAGRKVEDVAREVGVSKHTIYGWKAKYGGLEVNEAQRLRQLEDENGRLKKLVADLSLDREILKAVIAKNGLSS